MSQLSTTVTTVKPVITVTISKEQIKGSSRDYMKYFLETCQLNSLSFFSLSFIVFNFLAQNNKKTCFDYNYAGKYNKNNTFAILLTPTISTANCTVYYLKRELCYSAKLKKDLLPLATVSQQMAKI